jgi:hypothetical protein
MAMAVEGPPYGGHPTGSSFHGGGGFGGTPYREASTSSAHHDP